MIKNGKYRYTLQFGMETEAEQRVGNFLEQLGNRKSLFIVTAVNAYLEKHPELCERQANVEFTISGIEPQKLEAKIRQIVEVYFSLGHTPVQAELSPEQTTQKVSSDILDMLSDLECFE